MPIATGDKVRLFRKTWGQLQGAAGGYIGSNGDIVEVVGQSTAGLRLRNADGQEANVAWKTLSDAQTERLLLGFGHALTIDSAQGITSGEHINALPRGTAGVTAFKSYVAESRHVSQSWTIISEAATFEAVRRGRALGDRAPILPGHLWERVAKDMSDKPYKSLAGDLVEAIKQGKEADVDRFIRTEHRVFTQKAAGRDHAAELAARLRRQEMRRALQKHIKPLIAAVERRDEVIRELGEEINRLPEEVRAQVQDAVSQRRQAHEVIEQTMPPVRSTPSVGF